MSKAVTTVILDTTVVAGVYSDVKTPQNVHSWKASVSVIVNSLDSARVLIPPPVCFELCKWNETWYQKVHQDENKVFKYGSGFIPAYIWRKAALYLIETRGNKSDKNTYQVKEKISDMDSFIAAYSLIFGYYVITANQSDFPPSHFDLIFTDEVMNGVGQQRQFLYLLAPKKK